MIKKRRGRHKTTLLWSLPSLNVSDEVKRDVFGVFLFALAAISILSFMALAGRVGEGLNYFLRTAFGLGFFLFPLVLLIWGFRIINEENLFKSETYLFGILLAFVSILGLLHLSYDPVVMFEEARQGAGGGLVGAALAWTLFSLLGKWGSYIVTLAFLVVAIVIVFEVALADIFRFFSFSRHSDEEEEAPNKSNRAQTKAAPATSGGVLSSLRKKMQKNSQATEEATEKEGVAEETTDNTPPAFTVKKFGATASENSAAAKEPEPPRVKTYVRKPAGNWIVPPPSLLESADSEPTSGDIKANSNIIKRTLANFGITVEMGEVSIGPTVTQYTLKPSEGVKLSRITALQNDLAMALAARALRIEAPIPGKSWVGIELPNESVAMVTLKSILESTEFKQRKSNLSMILGRDVAGNSVIANIAKMPHLMIAGSTGSGKTVCVNTLISGLLFQNSPDELKFIMVDPKRVELTPYNDIPHLLTPVITDPEKAINALKWAVKEMENRYDMLSRFGCRNLESYNQMIAAGKIKEQDPLHYIVIIIDEMADLMATHGREMEAVIVRLAQMARAIGIHLVLSTQRPSVEVITGLIKANITTRIAFLVASQIDSRTILDAAGAEKLLGNGDMLYQSGDANQPKRIQGVFISEEEVRKLVDFIREQKTEEPDYDEEIVENKKFASDPMAENSDVDDDLYEEALEVVRSAGKASASLLQRRLRVGYARAARLLDLMEEQGVIGPAQGAKPREIYLETATSEDDEGGEEDPEI